MKKLNSVSSIVLFSFTFVISSLIFTNTSLLSNTLKQYSLKEPMYTQYSISDLIGKNNNNSKNNSTSLIEDKPVYLHEWSKFFVSKLKQNSTSLKDININIANNTNNTNTNNKPLFSPNSFYKNTFYFDNIKNFNAVNNITSDTLTNKELVKKFKEKYFEKDHIGNLNIPTEDSFFVILSRKNINILSSRKAEQARTIDLVDLSNILIQKNNNINDNNNNNTNSTFLYLGINDLGEFNEGFCLQILTVSYLSYTFCFESNEIKRNWLDTLTRIVINKQLEVFTNANKINNLAFFSTLKKEANENKEIIELHFSNVKNWVAISPWSECSKECDGGKSFLKRTCIEFSSKFSNNNNEFENRCKGEAILTKDCNMHSCDDNNTDNDNRGSNNKNIFNKEINKSNKNENNYNTNSLKSFSEVNISKINRDYTSSHKNTGNSLRPFQFIPISTKKNRYEKCIIKEDDLALLIDSGSLKGSKIPVRVLLTNSTLSIYSSDDYKSLIVSHDLASIVKLKLLKSDNTCFEVFDNNDKTTVLCSFISNRHTLPELAKEWLDDILYFIKNCSKYYILGQKSKLNLNDYDPETTEKNTLDIYSKKQDSEIERIISRTQSLAISALEKELKVESLIEKEEENKVKETQSQMLQELEKIQKQKDLVEKKMEMKRKEAVLFSKKLELRKKIKEIKDQVQEQINKVRNELKMRLIRKRKDEKRKKELFQEKINEIKSEISSKLLKASKQGDSDNCNPEKEESFIIKYCKKSYNDVVKQQECVQYDNFCYMCCDNEFGELHLDDRADCNSKCDDYSGSISDIKLKNHNKKSIINKDKDNKDNKEVKSIINDGNDKDKQRDSKNNSSKAISIEKPNNEASTAIKGDSKNDNSSINKNTPNPVMNSFLESSTLVKEIETAKKNEILRKIKETLLF